MGHIHTIPVALFVIFTVAYIAVCAYVIVRFIVNMKRNKIKKHWLRLSLDSFLILAAMVTSIYLLVKWSIGQLLNGCISIAFWNPNCYDLSNLNRGWIAILIIIGINAVLFSLIYDVRRLDRYPVHRKSDKSND